MSPEPNLSDPTPSDSSSTPTVNLEAMGRRARAASRRLATLGSAEKNRALLAIADALLERRESILEANATDIEAARQQGMSESLLDRLRLDAARLESLAEDVRQVAELEDPVGEELGSRLLPNGLRLSRRRIPLGVVAAIYEARPNVTVDIAALCLKTGNATLLRGGKETVHSNRALRAAIAAALEAQGLPAAAVQSLDDPDRRWVSELLRLDRWVDMLVPRGGAGLHRLCREQATIPVITGGIGICHLFLDEDADFDRAVDIVENAKVQRPSVCNALDTLLVHREALEHLAPIAQRLRSRGVELRADDEALGALRGAGIEAVAAGPEDFDQEWLSLILGIRVVSGLEEAIEHVQEHSTEHSDGILTTSLERARSFVDQVQSAAVYVNASTRFTDGGAFGLGAEVAVSTQKLHARGPMGLKELTTYKWIGWGDGHIRS
ncbi:MAG: glutamate-5-semialdehyde dehydrogenase [Acidobacteriota bacterium]